LTKTKVKQQIYENENYSDDEDKEIFRTTIIALPSVLECFVSFKNISVEKRFAVFYTGDLTNL
jgi:hypothetical protein